MTSGSNLFQIFANEKSPHDTTQNFLQSSSLFHCALCCLILKVFNPNYGNKTEMWRLQHQAEISLCEVSSSSKSEIKTQHALPSSILFMFWRTRKKNMINYIVAIWVVTYRRDLYWWLDLLTPYSHNSGLEAITALSLFYTLQFTVTH